MRAVGSSSCASCGCMRMTWESVRRYVEVKRRKRTADTAGEQGILSIRRRYCAEPMDSMIRTSAIADGASDAHPPGK